MTEDVEIMYGAILGHADRPETDQQAYLEQFMKDLVFEMEQAPAGDWDFKTAAANIPHALNR